MKKAEKSWVMVDMLQGEKVVNIGFFFFFGRGCFALLALDAFSISGH